MAPAVNLLAAMGPLQNAVHVDACWGLPVVTALSSFLLSIPQLNSGIFFVLYIDEMGATREAASWPKSIILGVTQLTGLLVGAIQHKVPILTLQLVGASLAPLSIIVSAFSPNMLWMSVTFGFFYGMFRGLLQIATSVYLVLYFNRYRSVALGFTSAVGTLAGVAGPALLMSLDSAYGLKGTLLVTGGVMLNLIPLTVMLRSPRPINWPSCRWCSNVKERQKITTALPEVRAEEPASRSLSNTFPQSSKYEERGAAARLGALEDVRTGKVASELSTRPEPQSSRSDDISQEMLGNNKAVLLQTVSLLGEPSFYVLLVAALAADFTFPVLGSTIADYGRDKGMKSEEAEHIITLLSAGGVCGHVIIPFIGDKLQCERSVLAALACALIGLCFLITPHVGSFASMGAVTFVGGVQFGYLVTIKLVLIADYLGVRRMALSSGLMGAASLPLIFAEPSILGIFRDAGGSYDNLYRICGGINLFATILLSAQACFDVRKARTLKMT
ncbi:monocarboxylate transporter 14-like isoform X2 [Haemaphysalis longicornis]